MSGKVSQIIGPVVDVEFPESEIPKIYNAIKLTKSSTQEVIVAEVQYLIGENKARAICMPVSPQPPEAPATITLLLAPTLAASSDCRDVSAAVGHDAA